MRVPRWILGCLLGTAVLAPRMVAGAEGASLTIHPGKVVNTIDEKVYGHFLEHIYHSVNGGLWGEMIWNRSFEQWPGRGRWIVAGGELAQRSPETDVRLVFGDPAWRDFEYTLEASKTGGAEGFLILFRVVDKERFYWYNLGGWSNQRHGLERGDKGRRQRTVAPVVDGAIETGKWYKIRVRCEGPRIQVWLDGKPVLDFTDRQGAHLAGRAGVGTWSTQARYRNLKVASLEGKVLFEGLPKLEAPVAVSQHWEAYGQGHFFLEEENPLNSETCQGIESAGPEAGIRQTPLCIRKGQVYRGSLWARGEAPGGMVVRLSDGEEVLQEVALPAPTSQWKEYPFQFKPATAAENAVIQVGLRGRGKVAVDQVSLMSEASEATGGFRPDLLEAIAALKPPVIRWPGGCFASPYRWKDAVGPQHKRIKYPRAIWDDVDVNSFGTDEFIAMCRKVGAEPLIVVNIGSRNWNPDAETHDYLQDVLDWIEYCNGPADSKWGKLRAANGHPEPYNVKYWEIDNETWHMGPDRYVEAVRRFAPAMRKADPSIKLAACGSAGYGHRGNGLPWNRAVIDGAAELVDYLSIHHYENPDRFAEGPRAYEAFFRETGKLIAASRNPRLKIYCSEWNAQSTDWRTGLYAGGLLNGFERCGDVFEIGGPALFLRHVSATAWDNAFVNFDHRGWFPAPNYVVMKLWREHYAPRRIGLEGETGPLNAVATRSEDGKTLFLKVVNPTDKPVPVELAVAEGFPVGGASAKLVAPGALEARNTLEEPNAVRPVEGKVRQSGQTIRLSVPRWSAAVVTVRQK